MVKPQANIILNGEKLKAFVLNFGTKQEYFLFQHSTGSPRHSIIYEKEIKGIQMKGKRFNCHIQVRMTLYAENPSDSTQKLIQLRN